MLFSFSDVRLRGGRSLFISQFDSFPSCLKSVSEETELKSDESVGVIQNGVDDEPFEVES